VTYDVATESAEGRRRLRHVANVCKGFGQRVQQSVFECTVNDMELERLRSNLLKIIEPKEDSLRIYRMTGPREKSVEAYGRDTYVDFEDTLLA
jgi:CRISPR-associated protein Cas2